jgi:hypothetical protein
MNTRAEPASENKSPAALHSSPKLNSGRRAASDFADNRPEASALSRLQELANQSERVGQLKALQQLANQSEHVGQLKALQQLANDRQQVSRLRALQQLANSSPQAKQAAQLRALAKPNSKAPIQQDLDHGIAQLTQGPEPEEEELIQAKFETVQRQPNESDAKPRVNNTGLPDQLKAGIESLSGLELDHVRVHYNSAQPAQLNALAYAQGSDIHLAPGQEQHLPHEAWHIVQQAQGRVRPTLQLKDGVPVNDDAELEREADVMGARSAKAQPAERPDLLKKAQAKNAPYQLMITDKFRDDWLYYFFGPPSGQPFKAKDSGVVWKEIGAFLDRTKDYKGPKPTVEEIAAHYNVEAIKPMAQVALPAPLPRTLAFHFDAKHGELHFIPTPSKNKSAWSITKVEACTLMEAEMTARMSDIITAAAQTFPHVLAWILVADVKNTIGSALGTPEISRFQIQLQADLKNSSITYHGFPDEQALHTGLGPGRNKLK